MEHCDDSFLNYKLETVKPASARIELRSISAAFNWAMEKPGTKYLQFDPFRQKGMIPFIEEHKILLFLTPNEKAQFLAAVDDLRHAWLSKFPLLTGCRRGEVVNLQWSDIDLEGKQITFRRTKTKRDRLVPINLELM